LLEIDGVGFASLDAFLAALAARQQQAAFGINDGLERHGLGKGDIGRGALAQPGLVFGGHTIFPDAGSGALAAAGTEVHVHVTGLALDPHVKIAHVTGNVYHLAIVQQFNFGMPTGIHHFGAENSSATVEGGESFIQLGHVPAD